MVLYAGTLGMVNGVGLPDPGRRGHADARPGGALRHHGPGAGGGALHALSELLGVRNRNLFFLPACPRRGAHGALRGHDGHVPLHRRAVHAGQLRQQVLRRARRGPAARRSTMAAGRRISSSGSSSAWSFLPRTSPPRRSCSPAGFATPSGSRRRGRERRGWAGSSSPRTPRHAGSPRCCSARWARRDAAPVGRRQLRLDAHGAGSCTRSRSGACWWPIARLGTMEVLGEFALGLAITAPVMLLARMQMRTLQATDARASLWLRALPGADGAHGARGRAGVLRHRPGGGLLGARAHRHRADGAGQGLRGHQRGVLRRLADARADGAHRPLDHRQERALGGVRDTRALAHGEPHRRGAALGLSWAIVLFIFDAQALTARVRRNGPGACCGARPGAARACG